MAVQTIIQLRQGAGSTWATANPTLASGELGVITDNYTLKIGDGSTAFNSLSGYIPNTAASNTFLTGQIISPRPTNAIGLNITSGMRYAFIASALYASNGAQVTYTYLTNGGGLGGGLISVGDYVTIVGFSNSTFNIANVQVQSVTLGGSPSFTVNGSGVPSSSATGNSSTWFYETATSMSDVFRVNTLGPGGGAGSQQTNIAFRVTPSGNTVVQNTLTVGSTLSVGSNLAVTGDFTNDITFSGTSLGLRLTPSASYNTTSRITGTATTSASGTAMLESKAASTATHYHQFFSDASGLIGNVKTVGSVTSWNSTSDYRRKENIVPIEDAVEKVKALKPSRFNFKHIPEMIIDGFIAHEVAEVVPMAVDGEKDAVDENGNPEYQSMDASKLIPILTAALQDALKRIEVLENKVK